MTIDQGDVQARLHVERLGVKPNAGRNNPEGRAAADRLRAERDNKKPKDVLEARAQVTEARAKAEADNKKIDPAAREKFVREQAGELRPGELTRQAQLVEKLINQGYDSLTPTQKTKLKGDVEKALNRTPQLQNILAQNPAQKDAILEAYLKDVGVRAKIREAYSGAISVDGVVLDEAALLSAVTKVDRDIQAKQREIDDNNRKRDEARTAADANIPSAGENAQHLRDFIAAQDAVREQQGKINATNRELADVKSRLDHFKTGGIAQAEIAAAEALLKNADYSPEKITEARVAAETAGRKRESLQARIQAIRPSNPGKGGGTPAMPPEYAALQAELATVMTEEGDSLAKVRKAEVAQQRIIELSREKNEKQATKERLENEQRVNRRELVEKKMRESEARAQAASTSATVTDKYDLEEERLQRELTNLQAAKYAARASLEQAQIGARDTIRERMMEIVVEGVDSYIQEQFAKDNEADNTYLADRLAKAMGRVDKALLRMYQSRWIQPGVRGPAVGGGVIGIPRVGIGRFGVGGGAIDIPRVGMTRDVAAPNEAVIRADFADLLSRGALAPRGELERMLNETRTWQLTEVAAGRLAREDVLSPRDIREHLDNKDASDASSKETAARIVSARMKLGKLSPLEQTQLENLVDYEWAHGEAGVIDMAMKINLEARTRLMGAKERGEVQKEFMDYARRLVDSKNSTGLITLLALLVGGVVPAGVAWYAMNQRGGGAAEA